MENPTIFMQKSNLHYAGKRTALEHHAVEDDCFRERGSRELLERESLIFAMFFSQGGEGGSTPPSPGGAFLLALLGWGRFFCSSLVRSNRA
jgi:hypothetical protein